MEFEEGDYPEVQWSISDDVAIVEYDQSDSRTGYVIGKTHGGTATVTATIAGKRGVVDLNVFRLSEFRLEYTPLVETEIPASVRGFTACGVVIERTISIELVFADTSGLRSSAIKWGDVLWTSRNTDIARPSTGGGTRNRIEAIARGATTIDVTVAPFIPELGRRFPVFDISSDVLQFMTSYRVTLVASPDPLPSFEPK